jgi:uncharacterized protein YggE
VLMSKTEKTMERGTTGTQGRRRLQLGQVSQRPGARSTILLAIATLVAALLALGLGGCSDSPRSTVVASGSVGAVSSPDTITVIGEATAKSAPDEAVITLAVESDGKDPAAAMNKNSAAVSSVVERIKREGVVDGDIETTNVSVYAIRTYTDTGQEKLTGFRATNSILVTLSDTKQVGKVLSAAIEAGANNVSGPVWQLSDDEKAVAEALKKAAQNARQKAEVLADSLSVDLGDVIMMSENSVRVPVYPVYAGLADAKAGAADFVAETPISAGSLDVTAMVTVTFALKK